MEQRHTTAHQRANSRNWIGFNTAFEAVLWSDEEHVSGFSGFSPFDQFMHSVFCSGLGSLECFVIIKCTKFGQLILRKIIKIVTTRCQILRLKCTEFDFGWVRFRLPQTPLGELTALPRPPSWI